MYEGSVFVTIVSDYFCKRNVAKRGKRILVKRETSWQCIVFAAAAETTRRQKTGAAGRTSYAPLYLLPVYVPLVPIVQTQWKYIIHVDGASPFLAHAS